MNATPKLIIASSKKMGQALALHVEEFKDAEIHVGFSGAREKMRGADVLADNCFTNMAISAKTYIEVGSLRNRDEVENLEPEEIKLTLYAPREIIVKAGNFKDWRLKQSGITQEEIDEAKAAEEDPSKL